MPCPDVKPVVITVYVQSGQSGQKHIKVCPDFFLVIARVYVQSGQSGQEFI